MGVTGGLLSILTVVAMLVLKKCNEAMSVKAAPLLSVWLLVLWIAVVMPCTFAQPFASFGNGYIGAWLSLVCSGTLAARAFADKAASVRKALEAQTASDTGKWTMICGLASIVVMIAGAFKFSATDNSGYLSYAVSVSVFSIVACVLILVFVNVRSMKQHSGIVNTIISIFLAVWWVVGAFVMTFVAPFNLHLDDSSIDNSGNSCQGFNGYFGTFAATFAALKLFQSCGLDFVKSKMANLTKRRTGGASDGAAAAEDPAL